MREIGMTGAPDLARGRRRDAQGRRPAPSRTPRRGSRLLRAAAIYAAFAIGLIGCIYLAATSMQEERERHQRLMDLRKADENRQGRVVHALSDGQCRMARFDNVSGKAANMSITVPCDTPSKDPLAAARDFNWINR